MLKSKSQLQVNYTDKAEIEAKFGPLDQKGAYVVMDLELTCDQNQNAKAWRGEAEIIQVGCVLLNEFYGEISRLNCFVKPRQNPILSDYCKSLTGISQAQVDSGLDLGELIIAFNEWFDENYIEPTCIIFACWGQDLPCLNDRLEKAGLGKHHFDPRYIDLKIYCKNLLKLHGGLAKVIEKFDIDPVTPAHDALNDALTTARLLSHLKVTPEYALVTKETSFLEAQERLYRDQADKFAKKFKLSMPDAEYILRSLNYDWILATNIAQKFEK